MFEINLLLGELNYAFQLYPSTCTSTDASFFKTILNGFLLILYFAINDFRKKSNILPRPTRTGMHNRRKACIWRPAGVPGLSDFSTQTIFFFSQIRSNPKYHYHLKKGNVRL